MSNHSHIARSLVVAALALAVCGGAPSLAAARPAHVSPSPEQYLPEYQQVIIALYGPRHPRCRG